MERVLSDDWKIASVAPLANWLGVSPAKVLQWISARELRATNVGRVTSTRPSWRISREAFNEFWLKRTIEPAPLTPAPPRRKRTSTTVKSYV